MGKLRWRLSGPVTAKIASKPLTEVLTGDLSAIDRVQMALI